MSKLIRIIRGVYGYKKGLTTIPKTSKDKPFEVDDVTAQRLIRQGVAKIATEKVSEAEPIVKYSVNLARQEERIINKKDEKTAEETAETTETDAQNEDAEDEVTTYSEENTKKELLEILKNTGYEVTSATGRLSKPEIIALLDAQNEDAEGSQPSFDGDGVVE